MQHMDGPLSIAARPSDAPVNPPEPQPTSPALMDLTPGLVALRAELAQLLEDHALAPNTRRAYAADWADFERWCRRYSRRALPADPETVVLYLLDLDRAGRPPVTLTRRCAAIRLAHGSAHHPIPTSDELVRQTLRALRRKHGVAPKRQAAPLVTTLLRQVVTAMPEDTIRDVRDRALLLVGFAGALRRSELCAIDVEHLQENEDGYWLTVPASKTDQEGRGDRIALPRGQHQETDPVIALRRWLRLGAITTGPVFRGIDRWDHVALTRLDPGTAARIIKGAVAMAGLAPGRYSGHSLRAGLITSAVDAQVDDRTIQRQSRHRSRSGMDPYVRSRPSMRTSAAARVGL